MSKVAREHVYDILVLKLPIRNRLHTAKYIILLGFSFFKLVFQNTFATKTLQIDPSLCKRLHFKVSTHVDIGVVYVCK